jgi:hypothetical protein
LALCVVAAAAVPAAAARAQGLWASLPTAQEIGAFHPDSTDAPRNGAAIVRCAVLKDGALADCAVTSETPANAGFGTFALSLAPKFRASPEGIRQMHGVVTIPIRFRGEDDQAPPPQRLPAFKIDRNYRQYGDPGPYFPDRAARMGVGGVVVMDCGVLPDLRLAPCSVAAVTPENMGFDDAARKMAQAGWMTAGPAPEGVAPPADGVWRFRVTFAKQRR